MVAAQPSGTIQIKCPTAIIDAVEVTGTDPNTNLLSHLAGYSMASDLVIVGKAGAARSHLYADQSFIYSDWEMTVQQIIKNNAKAPVEVGQTITVTRPGGIMHVDGRLVAALCPNFITFGTGHEYLLYLNYISKTGAYSSSGGMRTFEFMPDNTTRRLDMVNSKRKKEPGIDDLLTLAREAAKTGESQ